MFPNKAGNPLISSSFWQRYFQPALRATGLACRFHEPRHTSVALAIAEGALPKAIQGRRGHSSINVTLDRYGHLFPELDEAIAVELRSGSPRPGGSGGGLTVLGTAELTITQLGRAAVGRRPSAT